MFSLNDKIVIACVQFVEKKTVLCFLYTAKLPLRVHPHNIFAFKHMVQFNQIL